MMTNEVNSSKGKKKQTNNNNNKKQTNKKTKNKTKKKKKTEKCLQGFQCEIRATFSAAIWFVLVPTTLLKGLKFGLKTYIDSEMESPSPQFLLSTF